VITAKLLAEQKNPQADVVFGVALTSLLVMEKKDMLEPFKPEGIQNLKPEFVSQKLYRLGRVWTHGNLQFVLIKSN
jgi:iron(III) transport system substrate-binding protein